MAPTSFREALHKHNPYHDDIGRFTTRTGATYSLSDGRSLAPDPDQERLPLYGGDARDQLLQRYALYELTQRSGRTHFTSMADAHRAMLKVQSEYSTRPGVQSLADETTEVGRMHDKDGKVLLEVGQLNEHTIAPTMDEKFTEVLDKTVVFTHNHPNRHMQIPAQSQEEYARWQRLSDDDVAFQLHMQIPMMRAMWREPVAANGQQMLTTHTLYNPAHTRNGFKEVRTIAQEMLDEAAAGTYLPMHHERFLRQIVMQEGGSYPKQRKNLATVVARLLLSKQDIPTGLGKMDNRLLNRLGFRQWRSTFATSGPARPSRQAEMFSDVMKYNHNHDRLGRFATADESVYTSPSRRAFDVADTPLGSGTMPINHDLHEAIRQPDSMWSRLLKRSAAETATPESLYVDEMRYAIKEMLGGVRVWRRMREETLETMLNADDLNAVPENHFLNQHVSGNSRGFYGPLRRLQQEDLLFGYRLPEGRYGADDGMKAEVEDMYDPGMNFNRPKEWQAMDRPVYGYVTPHPDGFGLPNMASDTIASGERHDPVKHYGEVAVRFKPDVHERTTVTWDDSLGRLYQDDAQPKRYDTVGGGVGGGVRVTNQKVRYDPESVQLMPVPLTQPTEHFMPAGEWGNQTPTRAILERTWSDGGLYVEAQLHGDNLTLNDVDEIVFHGVQPSNALTSRLTARGISWRMASNAAQRRLMGEREKDALRAALRRDRERAESRQ